MNLDTPAGTVLISALALAFIGLLTLWIAGSRAAAGHGGPSPVGSARSHNLLAYVAWLARDAGAAQEHLAVTHEHLCPWPWELEGGDVAETHEAVRRWATPEGTSA